MTRRSVLSSGLKFFVTRFSSVSFPRCLDSVVHFGVGDNVEEVTFYSFNCAAAWQHWCHIELHMNTNWISIILGNGTTSANF